MEHLFSTTIYETPFPRAELVVTGRTPQEALENSKEFCYGFKRKIPDTAIIWRPEPRGFSDSAQQYTCVVKVTFGPDILKTRAAINSLRGGPTAFYEESA